MGIDWEYLLDAEGDELADAYEALIEAVEDEWEDKTGWYVDKCGYCRGIWRGKNVRFKATFSNHIFTVEECEKLLADEVIEFPAISKDGRPYTAKGKLENLVYNGHKYVGFKPTWSR